MGYLSELIYEDLRLLLILTSGSYRAQHYAAKYPDHVGNFVIDAVTAPGMVSGLFKEKEDAKSAQALFYQANTGILAGNRALLRADAYCQNDPDCSLKSKGKGSIPAVYSAILGSVKNSSLDTFAVQAGVYGVLQNQPIFHVVNEALALLATGNQSGFSGGSLTINDVVGIPYICSDYAFDDNTWEGFQESLQAAEKVCRLQLGCPLKHD